MSDWIEQYSAALTERDTREQAHKAYIDAYTKLADRTASLTTTTAVPAAPSSPASSISKERAHTPVRGKAAAKEAEQPLKDLARLRSDLATTQKARAALQLQVAELTDSLSTLQAQTKVSTTQIAQFTRQKAETERKLRDRDEELRRKRRLVEHAQDEMVALGLQLNMAEQRSDRLTRENGELVERWMKRMGEEAETMNRESKWE
ncbi:autophagy protein 16, interacts with Atg12p-Atg5p [Teratosphaeriaceae sp. CCFEE 6253]|nr:autophagy protein 16, interacts with Atg12p-Atg5p [Teratosphaeriaceae sp. CCFEE 6253]